MGWLSFRKIIRARVHVVPLILATALGGCVVDPNAWPPPSSGGSPTGQQGGEPQEPTQGPRKYIKGITFAGGEVSYFRTSHSSRVPPNKMRICLENNTGQPKSLQWIKAGDKLWHPFQKDGTKPLVTPKNGDTSCANFSLNQRVEFAFYDRGRLKKRDAMNVSSTGGLLVEFIWVRDY